MNRAKFRMVDYIKCQKVSDDNLHGWKPCYSKNTRKIGRLVKQVSLQLCEFKETNNLRHFSDPKEDASSM